MNTVSFQNSFKLHQQKPSPNECPFFSHSLLHAELAAPQHQFTFLTDGQFHRNLALIPVTFK